MNRDDFPILEKTIGDKPLVYFDSAATSLTPLSVVLAMQDFYENYNANVHRGSSTLGRMATDAYENARNCIAQFLGAQRTETIFTKNCSESLNLAAHILTDTLSPGDEILIPISEHHSNFVVWQQLAKQKNLQFRTFPVGKDGRITRELLQNELRKETKLVAFAHVSNVLGVIQPVQELTHFLQSKGILVSVDGAQGIVHEAVDVKKLGVDAYAFSSHKLLGPTGLGVLYMKEELLQAAKPFLYGGEMIAKVTPEQTSWNELPWKFEAGTPPIAQVIGLASAVIYYQNNFDHEYLQELTTYTRKKLETIPGLTLYGTANEKASVFSFTLEGVHALDLAQYLDLQGVQLREGHHCAQPLLEHLGVASLARISLLSYNTVQEVDYCVQKILEAVEKLK